MATWPTPAILVQNGESDAHVAAQSIMSTPLMVSAQGCGMLLAEECSICDRRLPNWTPQQAIQSSKTQLSGRSIGVARFNKPTDSGGKSVSVSQRE
jgi:hypothetical protein